MFRYILKAEGKWEIDKAQYYPTKKVFRYRGPCPFLEEVENGLTRCKIYSFRPSVCKIFPLSNECPTTSKDKQNGDNE
jgi:Fe-S-cluster containining protein